MNKRKKTQRIPPNDPEINSNFTLLPELVGEGSYSTVWKAKSANFMNTPIVVKVSKKNMSRTKKNYKSELTVLQQLQHPNILKLYSFLETSLYYYLVLEHHPAPAVNLTQFMVLCGGQVGLECALSIFVQLSSAIALVHERKFAHRDIKSDNVLVDPASGSVTLIDFGFAVNTSRLCTNFSTSPLYASPEVLSFIPYDAALADCWSIGVLIFQVIFGKFPFPAKDNCTLTRIVNTDEPSFPEITTNDRMTELQFVISRLLEKNPSKRTKADLLVASIKKLSEVT